MEKYKFLFKPVFFIFNLLFATWLVFKIESISPSDFGIKSSLPRVVKKVKIGPYHNNLPYKILVKKLCVDYKNGLIDSTELDRRLEKYLGSLPEISNKKK